VRPDDICNLAAQTHVRVSVEPLEYTANADALVTCCSEPGPRGG
jgi:GDP-D-mannose dehydratase